MIISSPSQLYEIDEARRVDPVVSLPGALARSIGANLNSVPTLFGDPTIVPGHAWLFGRWPVPAHILGPLQSCVNGIVYDAHNISCEDEWDVPEESMTCLAYARSILLRGTMLSGDSDWFKNEIDIALDRMSAYGSDLGAMERSGARYASHLPAGRSVTIIDYSTVEAALALLVGIQRSEIVACGVPKSTSSGYLNGREDWLNDDAERLLVDRCVDLSSHFYDSIPFGDDLANDGQAAAIYEFTPAETATAWQLFPAARNEIERHSVWLYKFGDA